MTGDCLVARRGARATVLQRCGASARANGPNERSEHSRGRATGPRRGEGVCGSARCQGRQGRWDCAAPAADGPDAAPVAGWRRARVCRGRLCPSCPCVSPALAASCGVGTASGADDSRAGVDLHAPGVRGGGLAPGAGQGGHAQPRPRQCRIRIVQEDSAAADEEPVCVAGSAAKAGDRGSGNAPRGGGRSDRLALARLDRFRVAGVGGRAGQAAGQESGRRRQDSQRSDNVVSR